MLAEEIHLHLLSDQGIHTSPLEIEKAICCVMDIPRIIPILDLNYTPKEKEIPDHEYLAVTAGFGDQENILVFRSQDKVTPLNSNQFSDFTEIRIYDIKK